MVASLRRVTIALVTIALVVAAQAAALASGLSGGNGQGVAFVSPIKNLGNAFEIIGGAVLSIGIIVIFVQKAMHRDDMGQIAQIAIYAIVGGAVVLGIGAFLSSVGVQTSGTLLAP